ncbi:uncharacterized protein LOC122655933 isoform X2 [Telopea speciosissima]|uniref:uncharacterized protein LOC122655933 isoform X2 n=1 Tax=Telopea speciosissima TaxID=54955 RepID=UPI001CC600EF|nr:uncharacterized protein LOC122655933 isoform X2 [Telopea speciosissima]
MVDYGGNLKNGLAYSRDTRSQWNPPMETGISNLVGRFSGLDVNDSSNDSLFQVMKAVEAAERTIKQQAEENNYLRNQLKQQTEELERRKSDDSTSLRPHPDSLNGHVQGPYKPHQSVSSVGNQEDRVRWMDNTTSLDPLGTLVIHQNTVPKNTDPAMQTRSESQHNSDRNKVNGNSKVLSSAQGAGDSAGFSQLSSPSSKSYSPTRYQREGEYGPKFNLSGQGLMPVSEANNSSSLWKQDLVLKVREHEEEILQLRKRLAEYSSKEEQIRNEKYVLEKRIAYMRLAFDQQQQDLVDAASKALSYRQDIIEENIRLTYALQAAQQERSTFVSTLLPLLTEYSLQPPVPDAQSIVSNLKVLFRHLQEKLLVTETKLKESHFQLAPWLSDTFPPPSPPHFFGAALTTSNKNGLELVPQQAYPHGQTPLSPNVQTTTGWEPLGHQIHSTGFSAVATKNLEPSNLGMSSPSAGRNSAAQDVPSQFVVSNSDSHGTRFAEETTNKQLSFNDLVHGNEMDDPDATSHQNAREPSPSSNWGSGNSPYMTPTHDDPNSAFSPNLPPVLEEPSSSFSEAAEDDPLPAIEGLQISGEAFPGRELLACGYSINGTTSCNFEWVRYLEDGSVNYIEGAKQPNYLVTADDVDSYLAIEVQPLDNRKRKGELVKVLANDQRKITCDPEMQEQIEKTLYSGHASYEVSLSAGYLDIWEPAILAIKKEGFSIKCNGPRGVVVTEKFQPSTTVTIPFAHAIEFSILSSGGAEHLLRTDNSLLRDTIVLTMRLFIMRAGEKRKGRKKKIFF